MSDAGSAAGAVSYPVIQRDFMLTFDDGPLPGKTDIALRALNRLNGEDGAPVRAGFFMVGDAPNSFWQGRRYYAPYEIWIKKGSMRRYPDLVAQVRAAGHLIGNHTNRHIWPRWFWYRSESRLTTELLGWEASAAEDAGFTHAKQSRLFRTPYLADTPALTRVAHALGYRIIGGHSVGDASPDRGLKVIQKRAQRIMQRQQHSAVPVVLIFHDVFPFTVTHLGEIVGFLQQQGYRLRHFDPVLVAEKPLFIPSR